MILAVCSLPPKTSTARSILALPKTSLFYGAFNTYYRLHMYSYHSCNTKKRSKNTQKRPLDTLCHAHIRSEPPVWTVSAQISLVESLHAQLASATTTSTTSSSSGRHACSIMTTPSGGNQKKTTVVVVMMTRQRL